MVVSCAVNQGSGFSSRGQLSGFKLYAVATKYSKLQVLNDLQVLSQQVAPVSSEVKV